MTKDIDNLLIKLEGYRNNMSEFDEDEMDLLIDALVFYKEMQVI